MGHNICALISKAHIDKNVINRFQLATAFEDDYVIIILDIDSVFYWSNKLNLSFDSQSDKIDWACEVVFYFAKELKMESYAIIQTDYFGGMGEQAASLYQNEKLILENKTINEVLKELGVIREHSKDEFDTINLGEYRATEYYYWDINNFADKKTNMIPGKIPKDQ